MTVDVFDKDGNKKTVAWLQGKYSGVTIASMPGTAERYFKLVAIRETEGPSSLVVRVYDSSGDPVPGAEVVLAWPNPEKPLDRPCYYSWRDGIGAAIDTNTDGHAGFGLGENSWIKDGKGPYSVWICDDYSDGLLDFGWLPGTNHLGPMSLDFQWTVRPAPLPSWKHYEAKIGDVIVPFSVRELFGGH